MTFEDSVFEIVVVVVSDVLECFAVAVVADQVAEDIVEAAAAVEGKQDHPVAILGQLVD